MTLCVQRLWNIANHNFNSSLHKIYCAVSRKRFSMSL